MLTQFFNGPAILLYCWHGSKDVHTNNVFARLKWALITIVFSATGGMAPAATIMYKRLASLLTEKRHQTYMQNSLASDALLALSLVQSRHVSAHAPPSIIQADVHMWCCNQQPCTYDLNSAGLCTISISQLIFSFYTSVCMKVPKLPCYRSCSFMYIALSQHHAALTLSPAGYMITLLLLSHVPCFVRLSITLLCQVLRLSITLLMCLALSQHDITPLFSALPFPDYMIFDRLRHVVVN